MPASKKLIAHHLLPVAVIAIAGIGVLLMGFNGLYGQDAYEYLKLLRGFRDFIAAGEPMPHSAFPGLYSFTGYLLSFIIPDEILALQVLSAVSLFFVFVFARKILHHLNANTTVINLYLLLFCLLSPFMLRAAFLDMSDMLNTFFCIAAIYYYLRFVREPRGRQLILFSLFFSCAIQTRFASIVILIIPLLHVLFITVARRRFWMLMALMCCLLIISIPDIICRSRFLLWQADGEHAMVYGQLQWHLTNYFKSDFHNTDGWQHYNLPNILFVFQYFVHPGFIFCGILLFPLLRRTDFNKENKILISILLLYALFIAGFPYQNNRYLIPVFPIALMIAYPSFLRIAEWVKKWKILFITVITVTVILQITLAYFASKEIINQGKLDRQLAEQMFQYEGAAIYTFSVDGALRAYGIQNEIIDMYNNRIDSISGPALLLFNHTAFSEQFEGLNPMLNWEFLHAHAAVKEIQAVGGGWYVYSIEPL